MSPRLIVAALLLACAAPAWATPPPAANESRLVGAGHPCHGAFDKFCAGKVVCGKGACHDCLNAHMADLDKACSKAMEKWDEKQEQKGR
jgi:hypothetical protein